LRGRALSARALCPDGEPTVALKVVGEDRAEVSLGEFEVYASVVIEAKEER